MGDKPVINIAGTLCQPETEELFNKWYDEIHIPLNMRFKGIISVRRYKILRSTGYAVVTEYPYYLTAYRFKSMANFQKWNASPELAAASEGVPALFARMGIRVLWRVQYESIKTWGQTSPHFLISIIGIQCPTANEANFEKYYDARHISDALKFKGLEGVDRCRFAKSIDHATGKKAAEIEVREYPMHLIFYYFKDLPAIEKWEDSPKYAAIREDLLSVSKEIGASILWQAQYKPMRSWHW